MNCVASFGASICPLTPGKEQVQTRLIRYIQTQMLGKILTSMQYMNKCLLTSRIKELFFCS